MDPNTLFNAARRIRSEQLQEGFEEGAPEIGRRTAGVLRRQAELAAEDLRGGGVREGELGRLGPEAAQLVDDPGQLPPHSLRGVPQSGSARNHTHEGALDIGKHTSTFFPPRSRTAAWCR